MLRERLREKSYPVSNGIGVGVLSYNRVDSLRRLVSSIAARTDLRRTTVFISDDASTDPATRVYLDELATLGNLVVLRSDTRLGVAGNTNRLMRCLARFRTCLLLNDDVEVLQPGWEYFYERALSVGAIKHFCMRQPGVYGAKKGDVIDLAGMSMTRIGSAPHGAVMAYTNEVFERIGYFDERYGLYGMEHVDWSTRVSCAGLQPGGFYDLVGSDEYFTIHNERSAVEGRERLLMEARRVFDGSDMGRGYIAATGASAVPIMSCVIPCRDSERHGAISTVIAGVRAQRFPAIEMIVVEHDTARRLPASIGPVKHVLVQSYDRPFNKSLAFNAGAAEATAPYMLLHDADLILPSGYASHAYKHLLSADAGHLGKAVLYLTPDSSTAVNATGLVTDSADCERAVGYFEGGSLACRRATYWLVGGFNDDFWGYGVEDCEFYHRLAGNCAWREDRVFEFVHMWHGRSGGWHEEHRRNKALGEEIYRVPMQQRVSDRHQALRAAGYGSHLDAAIKGMI